VLGVSSSDGRLLKTTATDGDHLARLGADADGGADIRPCLLGGNACPRSSSWHRRRLTESEQAGTQGFDLRAISSAERGDQKAGPQRVAAIARMAPHRALDQHIDLALEQLVQTRRLADAGSDLRLSPAELREPRPQIIDVDATMHPNMQQVRDALGSELGGRLGDTTKRLAYRRQVGFSGGRQDYLPRQPLEQLHAQPLLQQADLLADGASSDVQLVRGLLEAEMAGRRLEGAQRIERRQ
jgi:hypothetical protein